MKNASAILLFAASLTLTACGNDADPASANEADEFAARINGSGEVAGSAPPTTGDAPRPLASPTTAEPVERADRRAFAERTAADPASTHCDANKMTPFIGLVADARTRIDIEDAAGQGREIRFLRPGEAPASADPSNPQLNVVLDSQDIIRDAKCG